MGPLVPASGSLILSFISDCGEILCKIIHLFSLYHILGKQILEVLSLLDRKQTHSIWFYLSYKYPSIVEWASDRPGIPFLPLPSSSDFHP